MKDSVEGAGEDSDESTSEDGYESGGGGKNGCEDGDWLE